MKSAEGTVGKSSGLAEVVVALALVGTGVRMGAGVTAERAVTAAGVDADGTTVGRTGEGAAEATLVLPLAPTVVQALPTASVAFKRMRLV